MKKRLKRLRNNVDLILVYFDVRRLINTANYETLCEYCELFYNRQGMRYKNKLDKAITIRTINLLQRRILETVNKDSDKFYLTMQEREKENNKENGI